MKKVIQSRFIAVYFSDRCTVLKDLSASLLGVLRSLRASKLLPSGGNGKNLANDLFQLTSWVVSDEFNFGRIELLMDAVVKHMPDKNIWDEVYRAVTWGTPPKQEQVTDNIAKPSGGDTHDGVLKQLWLSWKGPYFNGSLLALNEVLQNHEKIMQEQSRFYGKILIFVQSSGMGKSRLADKLGETHLMINFILRDENTTGYPPPDHEILSFMRQKLPEYLEELKQPLAGETDESKGPKEAEKHSPPSLENWRTMIWNHSLAAALLWASFEKRGYIRYLSVREVLIYVPS
jgi:hypothetical protein